MFFKKLSIVATLVLGLTCAFGLAGGRVDADPAPTSNNETIVVPYGTHDGRPVEFVIVGNGRVMLRVVYGHYEFPPDDALEYLRKEVLGLATGDLVPVGNTGYRIKVTGAPIWAPHMTMGDKRSAYVLFFAEHAQLGSDGLITAWGDDHQAYYGYTEWRPFN